MGPFPYPKLEQQEQITFVYTQEVEEFSARFRPCVATRLSLQAEEDALFLSVSTYGYGLLPSEKNFYLALHVSIELR